MEATKHPGPTVVVIFGAAGDLAWRKIAPALFNLFLDGWLSDRFGIVGLDLRDMSLDAFRDRLRDGVKQFARGGKPKPEGWNAFAEKVLDYIPADLTDSRAYTRMTNRLKEIDADWGVASDRVFYLAVPPRMIEPIADQLDTCGLAGDRARMRVVFEKPFGNDLESARALNRMLARVFQESQIYRIDHYLGKETVQNIMAFRFANALFEPVWNRRYIDHVQITVAESVGVEHRGGYYEHAGALRDMIQNHMLQILCLIAMEPPVSFDADEVRDRKVNVLRAVRPFEMAHLYQHVSRGQYAEGWLEGRHVRAYRGEPDVAPGSHTETFAAMRLQVDNWRWQGVPFYLRTGKRLPTRLSEVVIQFNPVPHRAFPAAADEEWRPNRLFIRIQPEEAILLQFQVKRPGLMMQLSTQKMEFSYKEAFHASPPSAYETLLLDVMEGDPGLFMRADQVEIAWEVVMPVLQAWDSSEPDFPNYAAGSWGPESAHTLIARDGRSWVQSKL